MIDNLIIDAFAGGGGASVGIEMALGRPVDIAINHDPDSGGNPIAIHCECGLTFCTGTWDWKEAVEIWNKRVNKEDAKC